MSGKTTYNRAITTRSPDLPEEIGRGLTRSPRLTGGLTTRYAFGDEGRKAGLSVGAGATYVSGTVSTYGNATRAYLEFPAYGLVSVNAGYRWKTGKYGHAVGTNLRNALDRDLLAQVARAHAGREIAASYGLSW